MIRKCLAILSALSLALLMVALKAPVAKATSDYDGVYRTTSSLKTNMVAPVVISAVNSQCPALDLSTSWASTIIDTNNWSSGSAGSAAGYSQALQDALDHGAWAVSEVNGLMQGYYITAVWTTSHASLAWDTGNVRLSSASNVYVASITVDPACKPEIWNFGLVDNIISTSSPSGFTVTNFLVAGDVDLNYPAGYEGTPINQTYTPPTPTYVAMGDSFSSGEGNPPFQDSDGCDRSRRAYPHWLAGDADLNLGTLGFVACSGAMTSNVTSGQNGEPAQTSAITADTKVITITVGGDDAGFKDYVLGCILGSPCGPGTTAYDDMIAAVNSPELLARLKSTYEAILTQATNTEAEVYVVDYPYMSAPNAGWCDTVDLSGARSIETGLNSTIALAVAETGSPKLHYVNTNIPGSPFENKYLCGSSPDFGITTLHPNAQGQQDYATVVKDYIQSH